jgi:hypothetical protein
MSVASDSKITRVERPARSPAVVTNATTVPSTLLPGECDAARPARPSRPAETSRVSMARRCTRRPWTRAP